MTEENQSFATLKLLLGILILNYLLRNKTQKGRLTLRHGCPRDSGKGPELTRPSLARIRYSRWDGSKQGLLAGSPSVFHRFWVVLREFICQVCSALPQLLVNCLFPLKSQSPNPLSLLSIVTYKPQLPNAFWGLISYDTPSMCIHNKFWTFSPVNLSLSI